MNGRSVLEWRQRIRKFRSARFKNGTLPFGDQARLDRRFFLQGSDLEPFDRAGDCSAASGFYLVTLEDDVGSPDGDEVVISQAQLVLPIDTQAGHP